MSVCLCVLCVCACVFVAGILLSCDRVTSSINGLCLSRGKRILMTMLIAVSVRACARPFVHPSVRPSVWSLPDRTVLAVSLSLSQSLFSN